MILVWLTVAIFCSNIEVEFCNKELGDQVRDTYLLLLPLIIFFASLEISRIKIWFYQVVISIFLSIVLSVLTFGLIVLSDFDKPQFETVRIEHINEEYDLVVRDINKDYNNESSLRKSFKRYKYFNCIYLYSKIE